MADTSAGCCPVCGMPWWYDRIHACSGTTVAADIAQAAGPDRFKVAMVELIKLTNKRLEVISRKLDRLMDVKIMAAETEREGTRPPAPQDVPRADVALEAVKVGAGDKGGWTDLMFLRMLKESSASFVGAKEPSDSLNCTCGATSAGQPGHYSWCECYKGEGT